MLMRGLKKRFGPSCAYNLKSNTDCLLWPRSIHLGFMSGVRADTHADVASVSSLIGCIRSLRAIKESGCCVKRRFLMTKLPVSWSACSLPTTSQWPDNQITRRRKLGRTRRCCTAVATPDLLSAVETQRGRSGYTEQNITQAVTSLSKAGSIRASLQAALTSPT